MTTLKWWVTTRKCELFSKPYVSTFRVTVISKPFPEYKKYIPMKKKQLFLFFIRGTNGDRSDGSDQIPETVKTPLSCREEFLPCRSSHG